MLSRVGPKAKFFQTFQRCFFPPEIPKFTHLTSFITFYPFCTNNFRLSLIFPLFSFFFHLPPIRIFLSLVFLPPGKKELNISNKHSKLRRFASCLTKIWAYIKRLSLSFRTCLVANWNHCGIPVFEWF